MKTIEGVNKARGIIGSKLETPGLSDSQRTLLAGMLNALVWVAEGVNSTTVDRLLSGEPIAAGKDSSKAINTLRSIVK